MGLTFTISLSLFFVVASAAVRKLVAFFILHKLLIISLQVTFERILVFLNGLQFTTVVLEPREEAWEKALRGNLQTFVSAQYSSIREGLFGTFAQRFNTMSNRTSDGYIPSSCY